MEFVALLLSLFAIVVSVASAVYSRQQARSGAALAAVETERRVEEVARATTDRERARHADVDVRLGAMETNSSYKLIVSNRGPHAASGVSLSFVRALSSGIVDGSFDAIAQHKFDLKPGDSESLRISPTFETARRYEVVVRWTDGAGTEELVRQITHP
ncbi:MAG: hypothetical protein WBA72_14435 [Ornithinimicrobium sp.]